MFKVKKILFITGLSFLGILLLLSAAVLYLYHHPDKLLPYLVKTIAQKTHTTCQIQELSWSSRPWHIQMKGLTFTPDQAGRGFDLSIPAIDVNLAFTGPFGQRTLVIQKAIITSPSIKLGQDFSLPQMIQESAKPSNLKRFFDYFFFKEISFQDAKVTDGDLTLALADQSAQLKDLQMEFNPDRLLEITCGGEVQWLSQGITLVFPQIYLATDRPLAADLLNSGLHLRIPDATLEGSDLRMAKLALDARFQYLPEQKQFNFINLAVQIERILFKEFKTANPLKLNLNLSGNFNLNDFSLQASQWALSLNEMDQKMEAVSSKKTAVTGNDLLAAKGSFEFRLLPDAYLNLVISEGRVLIHKLLAAAPAKIKKGLANLSLSGPLSFQGRGQGQKKSKQWLGQCDLTVTFQQDSMAFTRPEVRLSTVLNGVLQVQGPWLAPVLTAKMETSNMQVSGTALKGIEVQPFQAHCTLSGTYPLFQIQAADLKIPQIKLNLAGKELLCRDTLIQALKGQVDVIKGNLSLPEISLESSLFKGLLAHLSFQNQEITLGLSGQKLDLSKLFQDLKWLPPGWHLKGLNDLELKADSAQALKQWNFSTRLGCREYAFENPNGNWAGEKIQALVEAEGSFNLDTTSLKADWRAQVSEGEMLLDAYYINFKATPFSCTSKLDYAPARHAVDLSATRLELKDLLALELEGRLSYPAFDGDLIVKIPSTALQPVFEQFIREPFKTEKPFLANLALGGTIAAQIALNKQGTRQSLKGSLQWQGGEAVLNKGDVALKGVNLDWPIWYTSGPAKPEKSTLKGGLKIQSLKLPWVPEQALELNFNVGPNQLALPSATLLKIKGGAVELGPVTCKNIYSAAPLIDTSLNLRALDLKPVLSGLWGKELSGAAGGRLTKIAFDGHSLTSQGKIKADLFGGEIVISDLGMDKVFSANPVFKLSAAWENLNLLEMTKDTEFGAIQGILQGYLKGFEIAAKQPQKFDLLIESVPKKGVAQKMSLRAVDNIARIGGGQSPFVGMAVIYAAFIQELSYKKIGIKASLENDSFHINGTAKEGGTEYLVSKGGLLGVNIVNQTPGLPISFKDMLQRIKGVFAGAGSPTVK
jgi:hypothetical protein